MKKNLLNCLGITLLCFSINANAQATPGTLTFSFTEAVKSPTYQTSTTSQKHVLAVWIQDNTGKFIKTKILNAGANSTEDHLPTYAVNAGGIATDCLSSTNKTDATTGATLTAFTKRSITWDGKNVVGTVNGTTVADGVYKVVIQETWNHGTTGTAMRSFTFTKGVNADIQTPAADANFTGISLNWTPTINLANDEFSNNPVAIISPNPSNNGVFRLDFSNEITNIKAINLAGQTVYSEKVTGGTTITSKSVDLSKFANGIYVISVSNDKGTSSYEVILNK
jgi:Secretion system C-terminal sorting domain